MLWAGLFEEVGRLLRRFSPPDVFIIHLGGNDIGKQKTLDVIFSIRDDFHRLQLSFPRTVFVFSEVVQRLKWLTFPPLRPLEKIRRRINRAVSKLLVPMGILCFRHTELEGFIPGLFREDRVHLSNIGLDIFNAGLSSCIELAAVVGFGDRWT